MLVVSCTLLGCSTKKVTYFQLPDELEEVPLDSAYYASAPPTVSTHVLDAGDVISINVETSDPNTSTEFTTLSESGAFTVNPHDATISLPYHGKLKVGGMTLSELKESVVEIIDEYYNDAIVSVGLKSFKIIVLGDVLAPGVKIITNPQINIIEALGIAGDIDVFGNRRDIRVLRNYPENPEVYKVDLTSINVFKSKVFYLQSNDILYVKPLKEKKFLGNTQYITIILAVANTTLLLFNVLTR